MKESLNKILPPGESHEGQDSQQERDSASQLRHRGTARAKAPRQAEAKCVGTNRRGQPGRKGPGMLPGRSSLPHLSVSRAVRAGAGPRPGKIGGGDLECGQWQVEVAVRDWETVL